MGLSPARRRPRPALSRRQTAWDSFADSRSGGIASARWDFLKTSRSPATRRRRIPENRPPPPGTQYREDPRHSFIMRRPRHNRGLLLTPPQPLAETIRSYLVKINRSPHRRGSPPARTAAGISRLNRLRTCAVVVGYAGMVTTETSYNFTSRSVLSSFS